MGMPPVPTDSDRALILRTQIGLALDAVARVEAKESGRAIKECRILRRWRAYLSMQDAKNRLPEAEWQAAVALHKLEKGGGSLLELQNAEERLLTLRQTHHNAKKLTDRLRKGKVYLKLVSELHRQLRQMGLRI